MKAYEVQNEWGIDSIVEVEREKPKAGPGQVVVGIKACSLNYRDLLTVQGKGGVSIFALQFAKMLGAKVVVTSSSDEKLERARQLGADATINYRTTPEWAKAALEATNGQGIDIVVEVGGAGTLNQSLNCARVGGSVVVIGLLTGVKQEIVVPVIFGKNLRIIGISVGSRAQFEAMNKAIAEHKMKPVIDKVLPASQVRDALKQMQAASHFGKICVEFGK